MRKLFLVLSVFCVLNSWAQREVVVDPDSRQQQLEGWGVSLCWWANMCGQWSDERIDEMLDWLVSPDGLNYNVFRYNIGGGDDPENRNCELHHMGKGKGLRAEMPGFKLSADAPYDWTQDEPQRKIMLKIREKRPDAIFEAFSNTPPYYMTVSGCCGGHADANQDNLRKECYEDFARYLVDVCKFYKDKYGIVFTTLEPFNEPNTNYWPQNGSQEGCHFDVASQIAFVKVLAPILKESGLPTMISVSDETNLGKSIEEIRAFIADKEALDLIGQWNVHTYGGDDGQRLLMDSLVLTTGKRFWQSETGSGGQGITGNLKMTRRLFDDLRLMHPTVWCDWQYTEEHGDQWCTLHSDFKNATYNKLRNYYIRQQVTHHILQGYSILTTDDGDVLAALSPAGDKLVCIVLNNDEEAETRMITIPGRRLRKLTAWRTSESEEHALIKDPRRHKSSFTYSAPAKSVTTFEVGI